MFWKATREESYIWVRRVQNCGGLHFGNRDKTDTDKNLVYYVEAISSVPCIPQHKMVCQFFPKAEEKWKKTIFVNKCKTWRLKEAETERVWGEGAWHRIQEGSKWGGCWGSLEGVEHCLLGVAEEVYAEVQKVLQDTNNHGGETMSQVKLMMRKELYMTEVQERKWRREGKGRQIGLWQSKNWC